MSLILSFEVVGNTGRPTDNKIMSIVNELTIIKLYWNGSFTFTCIIKNHIKLYIGFQIKF